MLLSASQPIWALPLERVYAGLRSTPEGLCQLEAIRPQPAAAPETPAAGTASARPDGALHGPVAVDRRGAGLRGRNPAAGLGDLGGGADQSHLSFWQEFQAEPTLAALILSLPCQVQVWRDGVLGFRSAEELVAGTLVLVAPIAAAFAMAPFPLPYLSPIAITPVAVLLADTVHKLLIRSHAAGG
jgi:hypothetical protein